MFLMDFFLPGEWTLFWYVVSIIIVIYGIKKVNFERKNNSEFKTMFIYAFIFMLLSMIISVPNELIVGFTGIGSYAAISGIGLSGLFFNPWINSLLYLVTSLIAVIFGRFTLTTFGANIFAIAFIGSYSMNKVWNYFKNRNLYFGLIVSIIIGNIVSLFVIIIQSEIAYIGLEIDIIKLLLLQISLSLVEAVIVIIIFNLLSDKIKNIILNK